MAIVIDDVHLADTLTRGRASQEVMRTVCLFRLVSGLPSKTSEYRLFTNPA